MTGEHYIILGIVIIIAATVIYAGVLGVIFYLNKRAKMRDIVTDYEQY